MNVQNIPRDFKDVKRGFKHKLDGLLFFDYKAIEVRLLGYYLLKGIGDDSLAWEFKNGLDPHAETAKGLFGVKEVTDEQRNIGKTLNFQIIYGGGVATVCAKLKCTPKEASILLRKFHQTRPGIKVLNNKLAGTLYERGYIRTYYGRKLHPRKEHVALNALIQGCAADLCKAATVRVHKNLKADYRSHIVNIVHDEIIVDTLLSEKARLVANVPIWMDEPALSEVVPIQVDSEWSATTWGDKVSAEDDDEYGEDSDDD